MKMNLIKPKKINKREIIMRNSKLGIWIYTTIEFLDGEHRRCKHIWCYKQIEKLKLWVLKFFEVDKDD